MHAYSTTVFLGQKTHRYHPIRGIHLALHMPMPVCTTGCICKQINMLYRVSQLACLWTANSGLTPRQYARGTRSHWSVEAMHHVLDVALDEDACRIGIA